MSTSGKKGCFIGLGVLLGLIFVLIVLDYFGNYCVYRSEPYLTASASIEESKQKGIFICTTTVTPKLLKFGNTTTSFEESWIEKQTHYTSIWPSAQPTAGTDYQICFRLHADTPPVFLNGVFMSDGLMRYDILSESEFKNKSRAFTASLVELHAFSQEEPDEIPVKVTW